MSSTTPRCPHCGSDEVLRHKWSGRTFGWSLLLFGIPLLLPGKKHHCFDCGMEFIPPEQAMQYIWQRRTFALLVVVLAAVVLLLW